MKREVEFVEGRPVAHVVLLGATVPADLIAQWSSKLSERMPEAILEVVQNDGPSGLEDLQRMVNLYAEGQTAVVPAGRGVGQTPDGHGRHAAARVAGVLAG